MQFRGRGVGAVLRESWLLANWSPREILTGAWVASASRSNAAGIDRRRTAARSRLVLLTTSYRPLASRMEATAVVVVELSVATARSRARPSRRPTAAERRVRRPAARGHAELGLH